MKLIINILTGLFCENDTISLTRILAFFGYVIFAIGSFYLLLNNISWDGYAVFASYTGGGGAALQFANKFVNSKYNSAPGSYDTVDYRKAQQENTRQLSKPIDPNIGTK